MAAATRAGGLFGGGLFSDRRLIALSRFGYLGSSLPPGAKPTDQADAYAALLDELRIGRTDVLAISAGTTSALQLALRRPDRIKHLVVMSGALPGFRTTARQALGLRLLGRSDLPNWALQTFARPLMVRQAGVPKGYPLTADDERVVAEVIDTTFPTGPRAKGAIFDYFTSIPDASGYDLEAIKVPTLLVHSKDGRIPGARLVSAEQGGHIGLGQQAVISRELAAFLGTPAPAERGAASALWGGLPVAVLEAGVEAAEVGQRRRRSGQPEYRAWAACSAGSGSLAGHRTCCVERLLDALADGKPA